MAWWNTDGDMVAYTVTNSNAVSIMVYRDMRSKILGDNINVGNDILRAGKAN